MKLVEDPVLCHSSPVHKLDSRPFQHHDNDLDGDRWILGNNFSKEDQNGLLSDLKCSEKNVDPLPFEMSDGYRLCEAPYHGHPALDVLMNGKKNEVRNSAMDVVEEGKTHFSTDKSVKEFELPELIVCYREGDDHAVKDICVDEGMPLQDKMLVENGKDVQDGQCVFSQAEDDSCSFTEGKMNIKLHVPDGLESLAAEKSCNGDVNKCDPEELILTGEEKNDETEKTVSAFEEKVVSKDMLLLVKDLNNEELRKGAERIDGKYKMAGDASEDKEVLEELHFAEELDLEGVIQEDREKTDATKEIATEASKEKLVPGDTLLVQKLATDNCYDASKIGSDERQAGYANEHSVKMSSEEAFLQDSATDSVAKDSNSIVAGLPYDRNVECGSITFNFDSSSPASSGKGDEPQTIDCEKPHVTTNTSTPEVAVSKNPTSSARLQYDHGEASFASVGQFSGLITYSGQIAYSGSLSRRSDSSTTSTRSFAFPVLQNEWNSSPVRMAKAERRQDRKLVSWSRGLLCCRF